jgi:hypothetical protein
LIAEFFRLATDARHIKTSLTKLLSFDAHKSNVQQTNTAQGMRDAQKKSESLPLSAGYVAKERATTTHGKPTTSSQVLTVAQGN